MNKSIKLLNLKTCLALILCLMLQMSLLGTVQAARSIRQCLILPIMDNMEGAIAYKVFEELETYVKNSDWCIYKSNSEILDILNSYKNNLQSHLENSDVLKIISEKTDAGALIRLKLFPQPNGAKITMSIIGENGVDLYFNETTIVPSMDPSVIAQAGINWLNQFAKTIPYEGTVTGILGEQFTVNAGKNLGLFDGTTIKILRPLGKRKHPLLKEIVDWDTLKIAGGKIFFVAATQSQGKILEYEKGQQIKMGDWVVKQIVEDQIETLGAEKRTDYSNDDFKFGKLGIVNFSFMAGQGSATSLNDSTLRKVGGVGIGISVASELWITRKFWGGMQIDKQFSSYSKQEGTLALDSNSVNKTMLKFKFGYKYLPLGFFYGPQLDAYVGYANQSYGMDTSTSDGFTDISFSGPLLGIRGNIPFKNKYRVGGGLDFILSPSYTENVTVYGEKDSSSSYTIYFFGQYFYAPTITLDANLEIISSSAEFRNPSRQIEFKDTNLKFGVTYLF